MTQSSPVIAQPVAWRTKNNVGYWYATADPALAAVWRDVEKYKVQPLYLEDASYREAIDEALVVRHLGIAKGNARDELSQILSWEVAVALDPRVSLLEEAAARIEALEASNDQRGTDLVTVIAQRDVAAARIEALEAELKLTKEYLNESGRIILANVARIEALEQDK